MFKTGFIFLTAIIAFFCTAGCNGKNTDKPLPYDDATEFYKRGWEYYKTTDYQRAYAQFKKAVELNPDYPEACLGLASCYKWFADAAVAENNFQRVEHNDKWAVAYFSRAIELKPDYYDAYIGLGALYTDRGWYEPSIKPLETAQKTAPEKYEAYLYLGRAYTHLGESAEKNNKKQESMDYYVKALASFEKYLSLYKIDPKSDDIRSLILTLKEKTRKKGS